jgi:hypothetical protein
LKPKRIRFLREDLPVLNTSTLPIFAAAAALLVGERSMKDILPPRALLRHQISGNAPVLYL